MATLALEALMTQESIYEVKSRNISLKRHRVPFMCHQAGTLKVYSKIRRPNKDNEDSR